MSQLSLFRSLQERDQLLFVDMDDMQVLVPGSSKRAIGTEGLNGCTCIVILGHAILMAHISPLGRAFQQSDRPGESVAEAGRQHLASSLTNVAKLIRQHGDRFPTTSTVWGIFACGDGGPMTFVIDQVRAYLDAMGYDMRRSFYKHIAPEKWSRPKGEVVAFYNRQGDAELYQESNKLWPSQATSTQATSTPSTQADLTPSHPASSSTEAPRSNVTPFRSSASSSARSSNSSGQALASASTFMVGRYTFTKDGSYVWSPSQRQWLGLRKDEGVQRVQIEGKAYRLSKQGENLVYVDEQGRTHTL